ncbi:MAG TPA: DUF1566 domain-containing protein [Nitrospirales bacterium]|jgi:hypothetical protein
MTRRYFCLVGTSVFLLASMFAAESALGSTTITLDRAVHFSAAAGGEIVAAPDTYTVLAVENNRLLLIPAKATVPLLIKGASITHEENISEPAARSVPGEGDAIRLVILLPGGDGREALGSYSGISTRALQPAPGAGLSTMPSAPQASASAGGGPAVSGPGLGGKQAPVPIDPTVVTPGTSIPLSTELKTLLAVQRLEEKLGALEARLAGFEAKVLSHFAAVEGRLDAVSQQVLIPPGWNREVPANQRWQLIFSDQAVLDKETGLVWHRGPYTHKQFKWDEAVTACQGSKVGGRMGWRLPTIEELVTLLPLPSTSPFNVPLRRDSVGLVTGPRVWSLSTPYVQGTDTYEDRYPTAWAVEFPGGPSDTNPLSLQRQQQYSAWCVRSGAGDTMRPR